MQKVILIILYVSLTIFDMTLLVHFFNNLINGFHIIDFLFLLLNVYMILLNTSNLIKLLLERV